MVNVNAINVTMVMHQRAAKKSHVVEYDVELMPIVIKVLELVNVTNVTLVTLHEDVRRFHAVVNAREMLIVTPEPIDASATFVTEEIHTVVPVVLH